MSTLPEVVDELRAQFKAGATPSSLIAHIVARHAGDRTCFALIQAYFQEAFAVPIVRGLKPLDGFGHADLRFAFLNEQLLHEMVQNRKEWDADGTDHAHSWLNGLSATNDAARISRMQADPPPDLSRCWPQLTADEQHFISMTLASANGLLETVQILARLAECLQQQVTELQAAPSGADRA